jgi:uncharacterized membrane protein (UPF0127 family)
MPTRRLLILAALLLPVLSNPPARALETYKTSELTVYTAGGPHKFAIEVALTDPQREQGLMFRRTMAPDAGMLFDMDTTQTITMWMKNTLIPLDMLFVDQSGRIVDFHERAVPLSLETIPARAAARYVIELNGGTVERLGIKVGDRVASPYIGHS